MPRCLVLLLALLASALALSACGSSENDEEKISKAITASLTGHDPAECEELSTLAYMEQLTDGSGEEAVKACEAEKPETADDPDAVKVTAVTVDGSKANADVAFTGGNFGGQKIEVGLVEEDGDWKLDGIERFVVFSKPKLIAVFRRTFEESSDIAPGLASCMTAALEAKSDEALEKIVLEDREALFKVLVGCEKPAAG